MSSNVSGAHSRRAFLTRTSKAAAGVVFLGSAGSLLAACTTDDDPAVTGPDVDDEPDPPTEPDEPDEARAIVGDVIDFALTSDDWPGEFGYVTMRLHEAMVGGALVHFIRTDVSDEEYAEQEELVFVPRMANLADEGLAAAAYQFDNGADGQRTVLSTEPGRDDYTPAFRLHRVQWDSTPRVLESEEQIQQAQEAGDLTVESTSIVVNYAVISWSDGEMAVDEDLEEYLGGGQLIEPPDLEELTVTIKLHECFPGSRYILTDTTGAPQAENMNVVHAPGLDGASEAGATGRVNVLMGGLEGPGPMGDQPSVFDSRAGDPVWSPYWDHMTYGWEDGAEPRLLRTEEEILEAHEAGELEEFIGVPPSHPEGFIVNCQVPVVAPSTFEA